MRDRDEWLFYIPGACPPKGSKVPVRKGSSAMRESSKRVEPWTREAVKALCDPLGAPLARFEGPVYVEALFVYKRPKVTEFEFPTEPKIGDLDKLLRCLNDALTRSGVIEDDRFIVAFPGPPRKIWGDRDYTQVRVGSALPTYCPARMPGGDWQDCVCGSPACGEAAANHDECRRVQVPCTGRVCPVHVPSTVIAPNPYEPKGGDRHGRR